MPTHGLSLYFQYKGSKDYDKMSRTESFVKNTIATALLQIVTMVSGFILPKIMLDFYGSEINGLISSITQLVAYLTLVEAGLSGAIVFSLYKPLANHDSYRVNRVLTAARNFYYRTGYLFLGLVIIGMLIYPLFVNTQLLNRFEISLLLFIISVNGILEFFTLAKYRALLTADQKIYVISLATIVQVICTVFIVAILSYCGFSIVEVRFAAIAAILVRTLILWNYCRKKYSYLNFSVEPDNSSLDKRWDALYFQTIGVIHTGTPVMLATFLLSLNDVSIYSIYFLVVNGVNALLSIFTSGLASGFGDLIIRGEKEKFKKAFQEFEYIYYILITVIYSIMLMTYLPFIELYTLGADINYSYSFLAILMTINGYFYNLKTPFGMLTISAGKYKESRIQITIQGLLEIICGWILAYKWGLNGIIIGAIISNLYRDIDFIFFAPRHLTKYSFIPSLKMWIRSFVSFGVVYLISGLVPNDFIIGYFSWIIYSLIIGIIAVVITMIINIIMDYTTLCEIWKRFKSAFLAMRYAGGK